MRKNWNFLATFIVLVLLMACNSRPPSVIEEAASVENVNVSTLQETGDWDIWALCGYRYNDVMTVYVTSPEIRDTVLYQCDADGYSRACEPIPAGGHTCECVVVPRNTTTFSISSAPGVTPALHHDFIPADFNPAFCEDDPAGWELSWYCSPGRNDIFNAEYYFPDRYSPTGCDLIDDQDVHYTCELISTLDDQACQCRGIPNTTAYVTRQIILADGSTVESRVLVNRPFCAVEATPTPGGSTAGPIGWNIDDCRRSESLGVMLFVLRFPGDYAGLVNTAEIDSPDCEIVHTDVDTFTIGVTCPLGATPDPFLIKLLLSDGTSTDHTFDVSAWLPVCGLADVAGTEESGSQPGSGGTQPTGCGLQMTYDDCKAYGGCYWWPHYNQCGTAPEPVVDCLNSYNKDQSACAGDLRCYWDGSYCQNQP